MAFLMGICGLELFPKSEVLYEKKSSFQYKLIEKIRLGPHSTTKFICLQIFEKQSLQLENKESLLSIFDLEVPEKL